MHQGKQILMKLMNIDESVINSDVLVNEIRMHVLMHLMFKEEIKMNWVCWLQQRLAPVKWWSSLQQLSILHCQMINVRAALRQCL